MRRTGSGFRMMWPLVIVVAILAVSFAAAGVERSFILVAAFIGAGVSLLADNMKWLIGSWRAIAGNDFTGKVLAVYSRMDQGGLIKNVRIAYLEGRPFLVGTQAPVRPASGLM